MKKIDSILYSVCQAIGKDRSSLAHVLGVSEQAISNWIKRGAISKKAKMHLIREYNIKAQYLESGKGSVINEEEEDDLGPTSAVEAYRAASERIKLLQIEIESLEHKKKLIRDRYPHLGGLSTFD